LLLFQNGAFHYLEEFLGRALQRSICLLHHVELILRAIFFHYDGKAKGLFDFLAVGIWIIIVGHTSGYRWHYCGTIAAIVPRQCHLATTRGVEIIMLIFHYSFILRLWFIQGCHWTAYSNRCLEIKNKEIQTDWNELSSARWRGMFMVYNMFKPK